MRRNLKVFQERSRKVRLLWSTPAVWPKGGTLSSAGGPCSSLASWSALCKMASLLFNEARRGVIGFGAFCRNKRSSSAGAKPGTTEHHVDTRVGETSAMRFSPQGVFLLANPKVDSETHRIAMGSESCILYDPQSHSPHVFQSGLCYPDADFFRW